MIDRGRLSRRRLLATLASGGALVALAGCVESDTGTEADTDANGTESEPPAADELDLRETNVVDVGCEATDGGYAFDVTLHHDDDGEEGYANWWQIERLDGTRLGRRELLHAHSEQPFTRSATVAVPDDVARVSATTARKHLRTLESAGEVTTSQDGQTTCYRRSETAIVTEHAQSLLAELSPEEIASGIADMKAQIQEWREEYGVDSPEEFARELDVDDVDRDHGALLTEWQTTRRNLALAQATLAIGEASNTGHLTDTDTDDEGDSDASIIV